MKGRDEIRPTLSFSLLTGGKLREVTLQYVTSSRSFGTRMTATKQSNLECHTTRITSCLLRK